MTQLQPQSRSRCVNSSTNTYYFTHLLQHWVKVIHCVAQCLRFALSLNFIGLPSSLWIFALTDIIVSKGETRSSKAVPVSVSMNNSILIKPFRPRPCFISIDSLWIRHSGSFSFTSVKKRPSMTQFFQFPLRNRLQNATEWHFKLLPSSVTSSLITNKSNCETTMTISAGGGQCSCVSASTLHRIIRWYWGIRGHYGCPYVVVTDNKWGLAYLNTRNDDVDRRTSWSLQTSTFTGFRTTACWLSRIWIWDWETDVIDVLWFLHIGLLLLFPDHILHSGNTTDLCVIQMNSITTGTPAPASSHQCVQSSANL